MITNYIPNTCGYGLNNLKKIVHIFSESANVIHIDNGEAYVTSGITDLQTISATSVSFEETTAYDDRFKFQKTITATVNGFAKLSALGGKYYIVLEDVNGIMWLVNADFPSLVTYTYTLQDGTDETVFTFSALSNFPTLKLSATINNSTQCKQYNHTKVNGLKMLEKRYANIDAQSGLIYGYSNQVYKTVRPYRNSIKVEETFDGTNANTTIQFSIGLDDYQSSWHYNMLEYPYNKYVAVIDHLACGFEMGLVPSYNVQGSHQIGGGDTVTVTLVGDSQRGSEWAENWTEVTVAPVYRWYLTNEWSCYPVEFRWTESGTTCVGYDKYQNNIKEQSFDSGETWTVVIPAQYSASTLIEADSEDCGYVFEGKYKLKLSDDSVVTAACNSSTSITSGDIASQYSGTVVSANIGSCVKSITKRAFYQCYYLTGVTTDTGLTSIHDRAFYDCTSLKRFNSDVDGVINIPAGVRTIGYWIFMGCTSITSATIPASVVEIFDYVFKYCSNLRSVTCLATTPPNLLAQVFDYTDPNLVIYVPCESVYAYRSARGWHEYADRIQGIPPCVEPYDYRFKLTLNNSSTVTSECSSTADTITSGDVATKYSGTVVSADVSECVQTIGNYTFTRCSSLTSITMPNSITSIGRSAFHDCTNLIRLNSNTDSTFNLPTGVTSIGIAGFANCTGATGITIPNSVTRLNESVFQGCTNLIRLNSNTDGVFNLPTGTTRIDAYAFGGCTGLTSVTIPDSVSYFGGFSGCTNLARINSNTDGVFNLPTGTTNIGIYALYACTGLTSVTIPNVTTNIGSFAFQSCRNLINLIIPNNVTTIGNYAFSYCRSLTAITIPNSVRTINIRAFEGCTSLTSVTISTGVTNINAGTFERCSGLTSITIPDSVTSIDNKAFYDCSGLTSITVESSTPPTLGSNVFYNTNNCPIYVPSASVDSYKSALGWSNYADRIQAIP